jgi:hypothetical protein
MTMSWSRWLPEQALTSALLREPISRFVSQWSEKWLSRERIAPLGGFVRRDPADAGDVGGAASRFLDQGLAIVVTSDGRAALAGMMLDRSVASERLNALDEKVVANLSDRCLDDLGRGLAETFGLPANATWHRGEPRGPAFRNVREIPLGAENGNASVRIIVATDLLVQALRAASPSRMPAVRMHPLSAGLAMETIRVSALAGRAEMTMAELAELAPGDIVVLDSTTTAALAFAVNDVATPGRCRIEHTGDSLCLKILNAPNSEFQRA